MAKFKELEPGVNIGYSTGEIPNKVYFVKLLKETADGYNAVQLYPFAFVRIPEDTNVTYEGPVGFRQR